MNGVWGVGRPEAGDCLLQRSDSRTNSNLSVLSNKRRDGSKSGELKMENKRLESQLGRVGSFNRTEHSGSTGRQTLRLRLA